MGISTRIQGNWISRKPPCWQGFPMLRPSTLRMLISFWPKNGSSWCWMPWKKTAISRKIPPRMPKSNPSSLSTTEKREISRQSDISLSVLLLLFRFFCGFFLLLRSSSLKMSEEFLRQHLVGRHRRILIAVCSNLIGIEHFIGSRLVDVKEERNAAVVGHSQDHIGICI